MTSCLSQRLLAFDCDIQVMPKVEKCVSIQRVPWLCEGVNCTTNPRVEAPLFCADVRCRKRRVSQEKVENAVCRKNHCSCDTRHFIEQT